MDWNEHYQNESVGDEHGVDRKATLSELFKRIKGVIFRNKISIQEKILNIIKISV